MKKYILSLIVLIALASCSTGSKIVTEKQNASAIKKEALIKAINSDNYLVKVNRLYTRRMASMELVPNNNYIAVQNNRARINIAYVGRSYDIRGIAAINTSGDVISREITTRKKGQIVVKMKVQHENDIFNIIMHVSTSGYCDINISHPRIDNIRYRGIISSLS